MKFEDIIKRVSGLIAGLFIFFVAAGMYLSFKGFIMNSNGQLVLVNQAQASASVSAPEEEGNAEGLTTKIADNINIILPKNHILGDKNAPITIYEFSSFGCTHCADFHLHTLPKLKKDFVETGKVNISFANFPLDKKSMQAALLAACMPSDKYFDFIKLLFKKQRDWGLSFRTEHLLTEYASLNGLSKEEAAKCLQNDKLAQNIIDERQQGIDKLKMQGTPALLIISKHGREVIHGAPNYNDLKALLEQRLQE